MLKHFFISVLLSSTNLKPYTCADTEFKFNYPVDLWKVSIIQDLTDKQKKASNIVYSVFPRDINLGIVRVCNVSSKVTKFNKEKLRFIVFEDNYPMHYLIPAPPDTPTFTCTPVGDKMNCELGKPIPVKEPGVKR